LPGRDVHGRAIDSNLYVAIGKLVAKLGRLLRKRKTRLAKRFERPDRAETSPERPNPPRPPMLLPMPAENTHKPRLREGGQEMRVFPFRRSVPAERVLTLTEARTPLRQPGSLHRRELLNN
jgi:hypothetical protein